MFISLETKGTNKNELTTTLLTKHYIVPMYGPVCLLLITFVSYNNLMYVLCI